MAFDVEHELHKRRLGRNVGLGAVLVAFIALVFGLTVVKVTDVGQMQGFDHVLRPELVPLDAQTTVGTKP
ncbi:hypothetical protein [Pseudorhodobacter ferrugineus]|uniref:hypothetical protein n=1 Tax=Pseudorhodobacter ferrugineus TaxID=77008 RepID=UPI000418EC21|nr:hypothetical protein [Pseudorhodobacter ferrugineus]